MHTLSNGQQITIPPHDEFYEQLVALNKGPIPLDEQQRLRQANIVVAGCGNVGGAVVEPLVRLGAERLVLVEPGVYGLHNMNRQSVRLQDIGRNKGDVIRERMLDINPYATVTVEPRGVLRENVDELVRDAAVIVDGVFSDEKAGITPTPPMRAKFDLHERAKHYRVPVIAGYPVAGLQLLLIYDYSRPDTKVLHGKIRADQVDAIEPGEFLQQIIPVAAVPYEMARALRLQLRGEREGIPQLVYAAQLFGVIAPRVILDLLARRRTRSRVIVDVTDLPRPWATRLRMTVARFYNLYKLSNELKQSGKHVYSGGTGEHD